MFDSIARLLGFGGVGLASQKEVELWEENRHLRIENAELRCQVGIWRSEFEDAQLKITAWEAKAGRRADKISELEAEVERLRCEKYPWRHVPGVTCEQPGKMSIEDNHGD